MAGEGYLDEEGAFAPWDRGNASYVGTDQISGTFALKPQAGLRVVSAEIHGDGQFMTCVFERLIPTTEECS